LFSAPKKVYLLIDDINIKLEERKKEFLDVMNDEQDEFMQNLDELETTIKSLSGYKDITKYNEVYELVKDVSVRLNEYTEKSKIFNSREDLFDKDRSDYGKISNNIKEFQPYFNLWQATYDWNNNHDKWLNNPWEELDGEELEKEVGS
jgi:dynein heavy chain